MMAAKDFGRTPADPALRREADGDVVKQGPLRLCGYCQAWQNRPCGNGCHWQITDPTPETLADRKPSPLPSLDLSFADRGERYETRAGWTATIVRLAWPVVIGWLDTDASRFPKRWRLDGSCENRADDIVEKLP